ncbi:CHRD domain-containing protein [Synechococcus elongatus IITB7]|uniref:CHRD domain-containing protein n=1 Tax=Synechococcus elongatus TaxID=32046 RepID=UPI0030D00308
MPFFKLRLRSLAIALGTCLLLTGLHTTLPSTVTATALSTTPTTEIERSQPFIRPSLLADLQTTLSQAESSPLTQANVGEARQTYIAILKPQAVVPTAPETAARAVVGAVLVGDRLVIRANFRDLSSGFRDYAKDPVSPPNPNITSGFHLHRGNANQNGPFQYALAVTLDPSGISGSATGELTLSPEQKQALSDGLIYFDIHTTRNRGGELRGVLIPS